MPASSWGLRRAGFLLSKAACAFALGIPLAAPVLALAQFSPMVQAQQHLRAVDTMTAQFTQVDHNGRSLAGELTLKRPGKVRFQYQSGVPLLVVGDGNSLIMIDYKVRQVLRVPVSSSPLSALPDPSKDLSRVARLSPLTNRDKVVLEVRDPKHPESGTFTFSFSRSQTSPAGLMLEGWTVLDTQGNRTTVHLTGQRLNGVVSDKAFTWNDPRPRSR